MTQKQQGILQRILIGISVILIGGLLLAFIIVPGNNQRVNAVQTEQIRINADDIGIIKQDMKGVATKRDVENSEHNMKEFMQMLYDSK